jgi:hypothetical protein
MAGQWQFHPAQVQEQLFTYQDLEDSVYAGTRLAEMKS